MTIIDSGAEPASTRRAVAISPDFDPTPSIRRVRSVDIAVAHDVPAGAEAVAVAMGVGAGRAHRLRSMTRSEPNCPIRA